MKLTEEQKKEIIIKMADCFPNGLSALDCLEIVKRFTAANILNLAKKGREYDVAVAITGDILRMIDKTLTKN